MKTYIIQILGETESIEKEVIGEGIRNILPKDTNFTFNINELTRMDIDGKNITGVLL